MSIWHLVLIVFFPLVLNVVMVPGFSSAGEYSLDDSYRIALEHAEKIKLSEEDLYIAKAGKVKALSLILPQLSAFGNYAKYTEEKYNAMSTLLRNPPPNFTWTCFSVFQRCFLGMATRYCPYWVGSVQFSTRLSPPKASYAKSGQASSSA